MNINADRFHIQYSFHSQARGLACDAVSNFEVVLADGSVVNANIDENPDLYKGLKGGSGNLGFVTKIDQRKYFTCRVLLVATPC